MGSLKLIVLIFGGRTGNDLSLTACRLFTYSIYKSYIDLILCWRDWFRSTYATEKQHTLDNREYGPMSEARMSRRLFLEGTVASGALVGLGSRLAWPPTNPASPRPARSATSRSPWPSGRFTKRCSPKRSTTSTSPRSPAKTTGSKGSSSSISFSRTRPTTRLISRNSRSAPMTSA